MVYLTKHNFRKLYVKEKIRSKESLNFFIENIYNDNEIYPIIKDMNLADIYPNFLDFEGNLVIKYFKKIDERDDSRNYVFNKGGKTKYHLSQDCNLIKRDFLDFKIPEDITSNGHEAVDEYRKWFKENEFGEKFENKNITKSNIITAFNLKYPKKYGFKPMENNANLLVLEAPNSSLYIEVNNKFDLEEFRTDLRSIKQLLITADKDTSRGLNERFIKLLLEYIKWTYDKSFEIESNVLTLEDFGLGQCSSCLQNHLTELLMNGKL